MNLIKNIQGEILGNYIDVVPYVSNISGQIQQEDYINVYGFIACTQNLSNVEFTSGLDIPFNNGLVDQSNKTIVTLEINY